MNLLDLNCAKFQAIRLVQRGYRNIAAVPRGCQRARRARTRAPTDELCALSPDRIRMPFGPGVTGGMLRPSYDLYVSLV